MRLHARTPCKVAGVLLVSLSLSACATGHEYAAIDPATKTYFGYRDTQNPDGTHRIIILLPSTIPDPKLPRQYWDRRAAEICGHSNYRSNIYAAMRQTLVYDRYGGMAGNYIMEGTLDCGSEITKALPAALAD